jgi:hypothetical protein
MIFGWDKLSQSHLMLYVSTAAGCGDQGIVALLEILFERLYFLVLAVARGIEEKLSF